MKITLNKFCIVQFSSSLVPDPLPFLGFGLQIAQNNSERFDLSVDCVRELRVEVGIILTHFDLPESLLEGFLAHLSSSLFNVLRHSIFLLLTHLDNAEIFVNQSHKV
jgi:hypothetical protein